MTWNSLTDLSHDQLVTEVHMDDIRENIEHVGSMKAGGLALSALSAGANLGDPDYDSGWYAVTSNTTYTKAHGIGTTPRRIEVYHSAVASPGGSDELVKVGVLGATTIQYDAVGANATNVLVTTTNIPTGDTVLSTRRASATGFHRILAWK